MICHGSCARVVLLGVALLFLGGTEHLHAFVPARGMFLVAAGQLADPRFHKRVILLIQHDDQASAGLVVNRDSRLELTKVLSRDSKLAGEGATLAYGGPVEPQTLLALVRVRKHPPEPADEILDGLYVTGVGVLEEWPDFETEVVACRVFTGYAGWSPGQLESELQRGDWRVLPADAESIFAAGAGKQLWEHLLNLPVEQK